MALRGNDARLSALVHSRASLPHRRRRDSHSIAHALKNDALVVPNSFRCDAVAAEDNFETVNRGIGRSVAIATNLDAELDFPRALSLQ